MKEYTTICILYFGKWKLHRGEINKDLGKIQNFQFYGSCHLEIMWQLWCGQASCIPLDDATRWCDGPFRLVVHIFSNLRARPAVWGLYPEVSEDGGSPHSMKRGLCNILPKLTTNFASYNVAGKMRNWTERQWLCVKIHNSFDRCS